MNQIVSTRVLGLALLVVVSLSGSARAEGTFHSGGVGYCGGCHMTHEEPGVTGGPNLLRRANATDTCLVCHATDDGNTWGGSLALPGPIFGGGSFIFLTEDNINDGPGGGDPINWIPGHRAGHNVVSIQYGVPADPDRVTSPGGVYPSQHLTCTSCHDPHNRAGNYRMLYARNSPDSRSNGYVFAYDVDPPEATGIALDGPPESRTNHTAFNAGWTDWCGACHGRFHDEGSPAFDHPVRDNLGGDERDTYDRYEGTGFWASGEPTSSYIPEVTYESLAVTTSFTGPTPSDAEVTCMSCHRAHASSGPYAGRWDFRISTWADEGVSSGSYAIPNPYETTSGNSQQRLCEKCHGQDVPN